MMLLVALLTFFVMGCSRALDFPTQTQKDSSPAAAQDATAPAVKVRSASLPGNALVERGRAVFASKCSECHDDNGTGVPGILIKYERLSDKRITTVVRQGLQIECCQFMSPTTPDRLSDDDLQAIIIYLRSVQPNTFDLLK